LHYCSYHRLDYRNSLLYGLSHSLIRKVQSSQSVGFSLELDEGTTSRQFCISCPGFLSRDVSTWNWHVSFTHLHLPRHSVLCWWHTLGFGRSYMSAMLVHRQITCCCNFHAHTIHLATEALLLPHHVWNSFPEHLCDEDIMYNSFRHKLKTFWF